MNLQFLITRFDNELPEVADALRLVESNFTAMQQRLDALESQQEANKIKELQYMAWRG